MPNSIGSVPARLWLILAAIWAAGPASACTIFVTQGEGRVLVGNNEDDSPGQDDYLWFRPHRSIGYVLWGHDSTRPEGGMNDKGLFFDAAALPEAIPIRKVPGRTDLNGYAVEKVLRRFATVAQALEYLDRFNLVWQDKAQIFLADAGGDAAIVHPNYTIRGRADANLTLTNHRLDADPAATCWRRDLARHRLASPVRHDMVFIGQILRETAQNDLGNSTLYSLGADLSNGTLWLYYDRRYSVPVVIDLAKELRKGKRVVEMSSLIPSSWTDVISESGIEGTRDRLRSLSPAAAGELARTGYELMRRDKMTEALEVFRIASEKLPTAASYSDLANALNYAGRSGEARALYRRALDIDASDYSANLMGAGDGLVTFRLKAFAFAAQVSVHASSEGNELPVLELKKMGDEWFGSVKLAKGRYLYNLHVDDSWTTDPKNGLSAKPGRYFASVLIVQ
jgi:tetratricopeptide (TPR) repeat protein